MEPQSRSSDSTPAGPSRGERWLADVLPATGLGSIWAYSAVRFRWDIDLVFLTGVLFAGNAHILTCVLRWGSRRMPTRIAVAATSFGLALAGWAGTVLHMKPEGMPAHWSAVAGLLLLLSFSWWIREQSATGRQGQ